MQLAFLILDVFQTISKIFLGWTAVWSAGTVHTHSLEVEDVFVGPFLFTASIRKRQLNGYRRCSFCNENTQSREEISLNRKLTAEPL